jgi:hypothetical protein
MVEDAVEPLAGEIDKLAKEVRAAKRRQKKALEQTSVGLSMFFASKPTLGEHRRWSQNGHNNSAIPTN